MLGAVREHALMLIGAGAAVVLAAGCGSNSDMPLIAGTNQGSAAEGEALYQEAKRADESGKTKRAIKLYGRTADRYGYIDAAPQARFRQAELLEQQGEVLDAFDAYQELLTRHPGNKYYTTALARQAEMAQRAADGHIKSSFLGLKFGLSVDKIVGMLGQVRENAPKSAIAAKAQFTVGELYRKDKKAFQAVDAFRLLVSEQPDCPEAPTAMFQIGVVFAEEADRGDRNQSTIGLAREAFNDYLNQYPGDSRNAEARQYLARLAASDAQRSYDIAEYYLKTKQHESAKVYFRDVAKNAPSEDLRTKARARLRELGE
jgi:outer membrane protein assembly factor BamD